MANNQESPIPAVEFSGENSIVKDRMVVIVSVFIFVLIVILAGISSDWGIALLTRAFK